MVDPKIRRMLARMMPLDDGSEGAVDESEFNGMPEVEPPLPKDEHPSCATLTGTWKQRKWAIDIRNKALALKWPTDVYNLLRCVADSTWWIANKGIVTSMKYKIPAPEQIEGPSAEFVASLSASVGRPAVAHKSPAAVPQQKRLDDALLWAESVSRHPTLAQAAILSCLRFAYPKGAMRDQITAKARDLLAQANMEVSRDTDAIQLMLKKE